MTPSNRNPFTKHPVFFIRFLRKLNILKKNKIKITHQRTFNDLVFLYTTTSSPISIFIFHYLQDIIPYKLNKKTNDSPPISARLKT